VGADHAEQRSHQRYAFQWRDIAIAPLPS